jgi:hypothetical protein
MTVFHSRHFYRGIILIIATIIMHFTPDYIDELIKILLVLFGIADLQTATRLES